MARSSVIPLLVVCLLLAIAQASHFRFGSISWQPLATSGNTVVFTINLGFRRDYWISSSVHVGSTLIMGPFDFGDGSDETDFALYLTSESVEDNWIAGTAMLTHTYPNTQTNWTAVYTNNARIESLLNNAGLAYRIATNVTVFQSTAGSSVMNSSPVSNCLPIINVWVNSTNQFTIGASDPESTPLLFSLASDIEMGSKGQVQPPGLVISSTGVVTWNTTNVKIGMWCAQVKISDGLATIVVDFLISVQKKPAFAAAFVTPTPQDGSTFPGVVGQPLYWTIQAQAAQPNNWNETVVRCSNVTTTQNVTTGNVTTQNTTTTLQCRNVTLVHNDTTYLNQSVFILASSLPIGAVFSDPVGTNPVVRYLKWVPRSAGAYMFTFGLSGVAGQLTFTAQVMGDCVREITCNSHGFCNADRSCNCSAGFIGASCNQCKDNINYYGSNCTYCVANSTCGGRGNCSLTTGACVCNPGYGSPSCSIFCNATTNCTGNGQCDYNAGACVCNPGFAGPTCNKCLPNLYGAGCNKTCTNATCGKGYCGNDGFCVCNTGFQGAACNQCAPNYYGSGCNVCNSTYSFTQTKAYTYNDGSRDYVQWSVVLNVNSTSLYSFIFQLIPQGSNVLSWIQNVNQVSGTTNQFQYPQSTWQNYGFLPAGTQAPSWTYISTGTLPATINMITPNPCNPPVNCTVIASSAMTNSWTNSSDGTFRQQYAFTLQNTGSRVLASAEVEVDVNVAAGTNITTLFNLAPSGKPNRFMCQTGFLNPGATSTQCQFVVGTVGGNSTSSYATSYMTQPICL